MMEFLRSIKFPKVGMRIYKTLAMRKDFTEALFEETDE